MMVGRIGGYVDKKKALGKGLSSLIPDPSLLEDSATPPKTYFYCDIENVEPNKGQPRKVFHPEKIQELSDSIREKGILQPLIVRRLSDFKYEIVAGERRWRAAQKAGLKQVPVIIRETSGASQLEEALIENIQREDLNPIEEAVAFETLIEEYQYTQDQLAKKLGKNRVTLANSLRLLQLAKPVRDLLAEGKISQGHAKALLSISDPKVQEKIANDILEKGLSVRQVEAIVKEDSPSHASRAEYKKEENPFLKSVEVELSQKLQTKVYFRGSDKKGKIEISYTNLEALNRVIELLRK